MATRAMIALFLPTVALTLEKVPILAPYGLTRRPRRWPR
jgi:hypothetical protein